MHSTLKQIYSLRQDFIIIGLTGRTGSGCTTVANVLCEEFDGFKTNYHHKNDAPITNEYRKDAIIYNFLSNGNWIPFVKITASDVIFLFALQNDFDHFKHLFIKDISIDSRKQEIGGILDSIKTRYDSLHKEAISLADCLKTKSYDKKSADELNKLWNIVAKNIPEFRAELSAELAKIDKKTLTAELQKWGNNIRKYGSVDPENPDPMIQEKSPACLAWMINRLAKMIRAMHENKGVKSTRIVIDALRNPFEILFFRERFSAFYTFSINTYQHTRYEKLSAKGISMEEAAKIDRAERSKNDFSSTYEQIDVDRCIELSDIFLTHNGVDTEINRDLRNQIARYIALILHPGLVPPSPLERVMQVAITAKLNSGCLSRQVGAAVTDAAFSVKAIGWNTVAEGQTPCSLRSLHDLVENEDDNAYSEFEKGNPEFREFAKSLYCAYRPKYKKPNEELRAIGLPYCFKDLYTTCFSKHKGNQVHTRSLHAEENAFLQLAKYGSEGIQNGMLFTTASCCELCGKKAYQLGIKKIYYIDSYPGITESHIFKCGVKSPEMELFQGAIGSAYIALYDPFIPLKDEIKEITTINPKSPIDYTRGSEDKDYTDEYIIIKSEHAGEIHDDLIESIKSGKIKSWEIDKEGDITSTLDDKRRMCWFRISKEENEIRFYLVTSTKFKDSDKLKAIFLGRLVATAYANYRDRAFEIDLSQYYKDKNTK